MDARAWRVVWVTIALFVIVGAMLVVGRLIFGDQIADTVRAWLGGAERAHWGLPAAIVAFTVAAFIGAPQFVLIAACVVAFGPERGFWYAWGATIFSGAVTFFAGRMTGADKLVARYSGATGGRFTRFIGKNAFLASMIVRMLPTAPFIVVNMGMAVAGMAFLPFIAGLAVGVLPKTAIVAFAGDGIMDALEGKAGGAVVAAAIAIVIWFLLMLFIRRVLRPAKERMEGEG
ncbi:MAG: TVP38/TMEM64 family protein [Alphaproteobacteria bacterium]|nr:TVP38/TMEM64 family protein [Alphaproteobacteria bacterium]